MIWAEVFELHGFKKIAPGFLIQDKQDNFSRKFIEIILRINISEGESTSP